MIFRKYDQEKDKLAVQRIWKECGWIEDEDKHKKALDIFTDCSRSMIVEHDGSAECLIVTSPGTMKYDLSKLSISAVTAVTVSRLIRKQGAAPKLLASMLKDHINEGVDVAGLGMFEQGFYNRFGFATMGYEHWYSFDPCKLKIYKKGGIPTRLTDCDFQEINEAYVNGLKFHGNIWLDSAEIIQAEYLWNKNCFGLGYKTNGKLSHFLLLSTDDVEDGPYTVNMMAYENWDQFLQLLGIIKSLEEQVRTIRMKEPAFIQLQDFIEKPFQLQTITSVVLLK